jgi:hypothetical protein
VGILQGRAIAGENAILLLHAKEEHREKSMLPVPAVMARREKENIEEARSRREPTKKGARACGKSLSTTLSHWMGIIQG